MKVISEIVGGLGNQMFCYAAAYAYSKRNNCTLELDLSFYDGGALYDRDYALNVFHVKEKRYIKTLAKFKLLRHIRYIFCRFIGSDNCIIEKNSHLLDERLFLSNATVDKMLYGYWQNEKYFLEFKKEILDIFRFRGFSDFPEKNNKLLEEIRLSNSVCIHYRSYSEVKNRGVQVDDTSVSMAYYISAIQKISASNNDLTYFLFGDSNSDEIQALLDGENVVNVELNQRKGSEVNDLFLMSECKHIVLANSSFSWWAGWLSKSDDIYFPVHNNLVYYPAPAKSWELLEWSRN